MTNNQIGKNMNKKQWIGMVLLVIGVFGILYSVYLMHHISEVKKDLQALSHPFSGNLLAGSTGSAIEEQLKLYDSRVMILLVGGITLAVIGGGCAFFCRK